VTTPSLRSTVNLENPAANSTPGAAPNGADFVPLQDAVEQLKLVPLDCEAVLVSRALGICLGD